MKKKFFFPFLAAVFAAAFSTSLAAAPAESGVFRIELREMKAVRETEIIPFADNGADPRKNVKVRIHTTKEVWALEKTADAPDVFKRPLGIWESDLIVSPKQAAGDYPVDLIMSLRLSSGTVKRVERHLEVASAEALAKEANALDQLRNDFVDLVRNQYWPVDEALSEQFDEVLIRFASKHMRKMTDELPGAFEKQDQETQRRLKILTARADEAGARVSDFEAAIRAQFKNVLKENEKVEEDTDFVRVEDRRVPRVAAGSAASRLSPVSISPQYSRRIQFDLTALALNGVDRYRVAEVAYHEKTIQFEDGLFRTNFRLDVRPMMRERYSISKNFEHETAFNEKVFLEKWKKDFWVKASAKLINAGQTEQSKAERAYIVTLLEPIIFSEQYAFPEFLAKAKYSFQSASTQKELRKLRKDL